MKYPLRNLADNNKQLLLSLFFIAERALRELREQERVKPLFLGVRISYYSVSLG